MGKVRLKEALEANDWAGVDPEDDFDLDTFDDGEGSTGFSMEATELEMEMFGMKNAIRGTEEDEDEDEAKKEPANETEEDVEQLESMMMRLQAVRGKSQPALYQERKNFS